MSIHEHTWFDLGGLELTWHTPTELSFVGDFDSELGGISFNGIAVFEGIKVLDVGPMTVKNALAMLDGIVCLDGLVGERHESQRVDGSPYAEIVFKRLPDGES